MSHGPQGNETYPTHVLVTAATVLLLALLGWLWYYVLHQRTTTVVPVRITCAAGGPWSAENAADHNRPGMLSLSTNRVLSFVPGSGPSLPPIDLELYRYDNPVNSQETALNLEPLDKSRGSAHVVFLLDRDKFTSDQIRCFKGIPSDGSKE